MSLDLDPALFLETIVAITKKENRTYDRPLLFGRSVLIVVRLGPDDTTVVKVDASFQRIRGDMQDSGCASRLELAKGFDEFR